MLFQLVIIEILFPWLSNIYISMITKHLVLNMITKLPSHLTFYYQQL